MVSLTAFYLTVTGWDICVIMGQQTTSGGLRPFPLCKGSQVGFKLSRNSGVFVPVLFVPYIRNSDDMHTHACAVADGILQDDTFLPILYELDKRDEWTDPAAWYKANPALGKVKKLDDLMIKVERAKQYPGDLSGVMCKEFNVRETVNSAWLSFKDINNEETFDIRDFKNKYAIGGADLSITTDLTCATLLMLDAKTEKRYVHQMYWFPSDFLYERVHKDKVPYDIWLERGLLRLWKEIV